MAIDVQKLYDRPLARPNHWRESPTRRFERNPTILSPVADRLILGAELNIAHFAPPWGVGGSERNRTVDISRHRGPCPWTTRGYVVPVGNIGNEPQDSERHHFSFSSSSGVKTNLTGVPSSGIFSVNASNRRSLLACELLTVRSNVAVEKFETQISSPLSA